MKKPMKTPLRYALIAAGAAALLVLVAPFVIPVDSYRGRIESAAATATGRVFKIDGPLRLTFFPRFGVRAKSVTLANVPGGRAAVMVAVGDIDLGVKILPLLSGHIALDRIVLAKPTIALEVDHDGNANWQFGREPASRDGRKGTLSLPSGTEFSGITITDGRVTYDNAKTNTHRALDHVNIDIAITKIDRPVTVSGDVTLSDRKLTFNARLDTLKTFLSSEATQFELAADADLLHAAVQGGMRGDGTTEGQIRLDTPSLRNLAAWLGTPLPGGGLNDLSLSSRIVNKDKVTRFESLRLTLDRQTIRGTLTIDARGSVPGLEGTLDIDRLNLNPYLANAGNGGAGNGGNGGGGAPHGWSRTPISVAILHSFNARLSLTAGALTVRGLHLGRSVLGIDNQGGLLNAKLDPVSLYGGGGRVLLIVDARGTVPQFANTLDLHGVQLKPFLKDMLGLDAIEGTGTIQLDIRAAGSNPDAILHSLSGKGSIAAANGRLSGVDLGAVARSIKTVLGGSATGEVASTSFADMGAGFVLAGGVLNTSDFRLTGPVVKMTGSGAIDIGGRSIDFRLHPAAGAGGFDIGVPFRITGSWDRLHYGPDVDAMIGGVVDSLRNGGNALRNMFGIH